MLRITSKKDGFRRAARAHVGISTYPKNAFTQQQLEQLLAEPLLVVELFESDKAEATAETEVVAAAETEVAEAPVEATTAKVEAKAATNKKAQGK